MLAFLIGLAALVVAKLVTDHQLQREGFNELKGGFHLVA
jgi:sensor domain CHASE-containing protein